MATEDLLDRLESMHPSGTIPYIEAQIWNQETALNYYLEKGSFND